MKRTWLHTKAHTTVVLIIAIKDVNECMSSSVWGCGLRGTRGIVLLLLCWLLERWRYGMENISLARARVLYVHAQIRGAGDGANTLPPCDSKQQQQKSRCRQPLQTHAHTHKQTRARSLTLWWVLTSMSSSSRILRSWLDHHHQHQLLGSSHRLPRQSTFHQGWS